MRRSRLVLGSKIVLAFPTIAIAASCGFSARIDVVESYYDHSEFVTAQRCSDDQATVDLIYLVLNSESHLMTKDDPLFSGHGANAVTIDVPEPFALDMGGGQVPATVAGNAYVEVTHPGKARGVAIMMDNSESVDGWNEQSPRARTNPPTDPDGLRLTGAQNFVNTWLSGSTTDRATLISFHGTGMDGVDAKMATMAGESPSVGWFTGNTSLLDEKLASLKGEAVGATPLYDALSVGNDALRVLPPAVRPIMLVFSDGPDNSSNPITYDAAKAALTTDPSIPFFAIGLGSLLGDGEAQLIDLACSSTPQGVYMKAPLARDLKGHFGHMVHLITGYWKVTLNLSLPGGLPTGTYMATGKMFVNTQGQPPKSCDDQNPCNGSGAMSCDLGRNRCYLNASFTFTAP
jgi:hypothetical protein